MSSLDFTRCEAFLEAQLPAVLDRLRHLVGINSHTCHRAGVNRVVEATAEWFGSLGMTAERVPHGDGVSGDHLVMRRSGQGMGTVAMVSHSDTVFSAEEEERNDFRWRVEGDRIYGPGTHDIKGGTAVMWLTLAALKDQVPEVYDGVDWVLLWNATEETLSEDFARLARSRLDPGRTRAALVFEAGGRVEGRHALVVARKGRASYQVRVEGRGSHAGAKHAHGANAITQLGRVVDRIAQLTDVTRKLTFNVGRMEGGTAINRVPHAAWAEGEMRAFDDAAYQQGLSALRALAGMGDVISPVDGHACRIEVDIQAETPPWPRNPGTDRLYAGWKAAAEELRVPLEAEERGGLSDGNWLWDWVPTLDGLGPLGDNDHCSERSADGSKVPEYVEVSTLVPKALLNVRALTRILGH